MFVKYYAGIYCEGQTAIVVNWTTPNVADLHVFSNDQNGSVLKQNVPHVDADLTPTGHFWETMEELAKRIGVPEQPEGNTPSLEARITALEDHVSKPDGVPAIDPIALQQALDSLKGQVEVLTLNALKAPTKEVSPGLGEAPIKPE